MSTKTMTPKTAEVKNILLGAKNAENVQPVNVVEKPQVTETEQKEKVLSLIEKFKPEPFKSAEERINRKNQFDALAKRYETLKAKDNELKTFHAGNDKTNAKIIFKNAQGFEFVIQTTNVIDKLTKAAQEELQILLTEAENEVLTFEI